MIYFDFIKGKKAPNSWSWSCFVSSCRENSEQHQDQHQVSVWLNASLQPMIINHQPTFKPFRHWRSRRIRVHFKNTFLCWKPSVSYRSPQARYEADFCCYRTFVLLWNICWASWSLPLDGSVSSFIGWQLSINNSLFNNKNMHKDVSACTAIDLKHLC